MLGDIGHDISNDNNIGHDISNDNNIGHDISNDNNSVSLILYKQFITVLNAGVISIFQPV